MGPGVAIGMMIGRHTEAAGAAAGVRAAPTLVPLVGRICPVLQTLSRRLHVPAMGLALIAAAVVFAVSVGVMSRADPAGACTDQNHSTVEVVGGTGPGGQFTKSQVHALQCMGMPAVIPTLCVISMRMREERSIR